MLSGGQDSEALRNEAGIQDRDSGHSMRNGLKEEMDLV